MEWKEGATGLNYFLESKAQVESGKTDGWDKLTERALMIQNFDNCLYSLDIDCPNYGTLLQKRVKPWSPKAFQELDFVKIDYVCKEAITFKQQNLVRTSLTLGDSHSLSVWDGGYIARLDGHTLHGAIETGFNTWINQFKDVEKLRTYFGNIDVRHHLVRIYGDNYEDAATVLALKYCYELIKIKIDQIEVVALLPIEDESRKLPKTGS